MRLADWTFGNYTVEECVLDLVKNQLPGREVTGHRGCTRTGNGTRVTACPEPADQGLQYARPSSSRNFLDVCGHSQEKNGLVKLLTSAVNLGDGRNAEERRV